MAGLQFCATFYVYNFPSDGISPIPKLNGEDQMQPRHFLQHLPQILNEHKVRGGFDVLLSFYHNFGDQERFRHI